MSDVAFAGVTLQELEGGVLSRTLVEHDSCSSTCMQKQGTRVEDAVQVQ